VIRSLPEKVGHVQRRVRQRLDHELLVPRQARAQPVVPDAGPLVQPADGVFVLAAGVLRDGVEVLDGTQGLLAPLLVVVAQEPRLLVGDLHVAAAATDDLLGELLHRVERVAGVVLAERVAHVLDDLAGELAVLVVQHAGVELGVVQVVGGLLQRGVVARLDAVLFHRGLGRDLAVPLDREDRDRLDRPDGVGVDPVRGQVVGARLQLLQRDVVVRRVRRDGHHDAGRVVGVDEAGGQDQHVVAGDRVLDGGADDVAAGELGLDLDLAVLQVELLGGVRGDHPRLAVDARTDVRRFGVDVGVRDAPNRLRAERRHREDGIVGIGRVAAEAHEGVLLELRVLTLQQVVGGDWLLLVGAVVHRVEPLLDQPRLLQRSVLPLDELRVALVVGGELPAPVDREPQGLHPLLVVLLDEVLRKAHRRLQVAQVLLGDVVRVLQHRELLRLPLLQALDGADDRRPGDVPRHREQHVVALLASIPGVGVRHRVRAGVADVHPAAGVGVRHRDERRVVAVRPLGRIGLVPALLPPALPPALLYRLRVVVHTRECRSGGKNTHQF